MRPRPALRRRNVSLSRSVYGSRVFSLENKLLAFITIQRVVDVYRREIGKRNVKLYLQ